MAKILSCSSWMGSRRFVHFPTLRTVLCVYVSVHAFLQERVKRVFRQVCVATPHRDPAKVKRIYFKGKKLLL